MTEPDETNIKKIQICDGKKTSIMYPEKSYLNIDHRVKTKKWLQLESTRNAICK